MFTARIAYFVPLLKIADFLHAGVEMSPLYPVVELPKLERVGWVLPQDGEPRILVECMR